MDILRELNNINNDKLVCVGMPTYNRGKVLENAIVSLLNQSYRPLEIIISNNASNDNTYEICEKYKKSFSEITVIHNKKNIGMLLNAYSVLNNASGEYFMWANDDDTWDSDFIKTNIESLESEKNNIGAFSNYQISVKRNNITTLYKNKDYHQCLTFSKSYDRAKGFIEIMDSKIQGKGIPICGVFRREVLKNMYLTMHGAFPDFLNIFELTLIGPMSYSKNIYLYKNKSRWIEQTENIKKNPLFNPEITNSFKKGRLFQEFSNYNKMHSFASKSQLLSNEKLILHILIFRWFLKRTFNFYVVKMIKNRIKRTLLR